MLYSGSWRTQCISYTLPAQAHFIQEPSLVTKALCLCVCDYQSIALITLRGQKGLIISHALCNHVPVNGDHGCVLSVLNGTLASLIITAVLLD